MYNLHIAFSFNEHAGIGIISRDSKLLYLDIRQTMDSTQ